MNGSTATAAGLGGLGGGQVLQWIWNDLLAWTLANPVPVMPIEVAGPIAAALVGAATYSVLRWLK